MKKVKNPDRERQKRITEAADVYALCDEERRLVREGLAELDRGEVGDRR